MVLDMLHSGMLFSFMQLPGLHDQSVVKGMEQVQRLCLLLCCSGLLETQT